MMPKAKVIIVGIVAVAVLVAVVAVLWGINQETASVTETAEKKMADLPQEPWVEVVEPGVTARRGDGAEGKILQSGDAVPAGTVLETTGSGRAIVHFADGSVARLDPGTALTIQAAQFDPQSEKSIVRLSLSVGRVWSKILELATPDSLWEVKTANAVATVRGTSFGVGFLEGQSRIVVSEDRVEAAVVDPQTGLVVERARATVAPDQFISVRTEDVPKIKEEPALRSQIVSAAPAEVRNWQAQNKAEDVKFEDKLETLRERGLEGRELRDEFRRQIFEEIKQEAPQSSEGTGREGMPSAPQTEQGSREPVSPGDRPQAPRAAPPGAREGHAAGAVNLLVAVAKWTLRGVTEGDRITFTATLEWADRSTRDVTAEVRWTVVGPIGRMVGPGIFEAALSPAVQEFGSAPGVVAATWTDPGNGRELTGATPTFSVSAKIPEDLPREG